MTAVSGPLTTGGPPAAAGGGGGAGGGDQRARWFMLGAVGVTGLLYVVPYGELVAYPLVLISTLAHEMGHGVAALLVGAEFNSLRMWADGSGLAELGAISGRLEHAFVSAGGLVGPAVAAALLFWLAARPKPARVGLGLLGALLALACLLVVRNLFGLFFVGLCAAIALGLALKASPRAAQIALVFVGVQLALSVYSRGDYLFTDVAQTSAGPQPSDVAQMADALLLPYWFWGAVCGLFSIAVLVFGLHRFWRATGAAADAAPSRAD